MGHGLLMFVLMKWISLSCFFCSIVKIFTKEVGGDIGFHEYLREFVICNVTFPHEFKSYRVDKRGI